MKTLRQLEIEEDIRSRHDGTLCLADVGNEIGIKFRPSIEKFVKGVPCYYINGHRRWRVSDIAKRLADLEVVE